MEQGTQVTAIAIRTEEERVAVVDRARAMLERARTPIEAKQIHDLARAAETYARLQKAGEEAVRHAQAIAVDALALMGDMLKQVQKNTGAQGVGPIAVPTGNRNRETLPTLEQQGITKKQSMLAQSLATAKETQPDLFEQVKAGEVSVTAAHAEVKRQEREPAAVAPAWSAPKPRPSWMTGGSKVDPDHPHADVLKAMTALVKVVNKALARDDAAAGALKANLSEFTKLVKCRQVLHTSGLIANGVVTAPAAKFVGLSLLRSLVRKSTKKMTPLQLRKLFEENGSAPAETILSEEGDE